MGKLSDKRLFLLDMDGTIYLDNDLFDGTLDFLEKVKADGGKYLFLTNNSSKGAKAYVEKLKKIGISSVEEDFLTSTNVTVMHVNSNYPGKKFYAMGTKSFVDELVANGVNAVTELSDDIFGLIISNDTELTFKKLDDACVLLKRDIVYIATNPDWVCPTWYGYVPDCGSFADIIRRATGKMPQFIGKPQPQMILTAMAKYGYQKSETVMIGDRLYTDIASGYNAGIDTIFVLSGEGTLADIETSEVKPTHVFQNIREVYNEL